MARKNWRSKEIRRLRQTLLGPDFNERIKEITESVGTNITVRKAGTVLGMLLCKLAIIRLRLIKLSPQPRNAENYPKTEDYLEESRREDLPLAPQPPTLWLQRQLPERPVSIAIRSEGSPKQDVNTRHN